MAGPKKISQLLDREQGSIANLEYLIIASASGRLRPEKVQVLLDMITSGNIALRNYADITDMLSNTVMSDNTFAKVNNGAGQNGITSGWVLYQYLGGGRADINNYFLLLAEQWFTAEHISFTPGSGLTSEKVQDAILELKSHIDSVSTGIKWKEPVYTVATSNITLQGEQTINGKLTSASRVLVTGQTNPALNGIYVSSSSPWLRSEDADTAEELEGAVVEVESGGNAPYEQGGQFRQLSTGFTLNTDPVQWLDTSSSSLPDASETVKGKVQLADQTTAETASDPVVTNRNHTRPLTARALMWALNQLDIVFGTELASHINDDTNPHGVTKTQVGLGNVDNTSDADKPVSTLQQAALDDKMDLVDTDKVNEILQVNGDGGAIPSGKKWAVLTDVEKTTGHSDGLVPSVLRVFNGFVYWVLNYSFSALNTTAKTLVGAINELLALVENNQGGGGHVIADESQDLPQRSKLQFIGATVTDDEANDQTVVTIDSGGGAGTFDPVQDLTALQAIDTTDSEVWKDKWAILVEDEGAWYRLDRDSSVAETLPYIVAPTTGSGRWIQDQYSQMQGKVDKVGGDNQLEVTISTPSTWYGAATQMLRAAIQKIHDFINTSVFKVSDVDVTDISEGESKIPTVVKQGGVPVITGAVRKVDKLGPATLANYLDDSKSWVNGVLEINGANPEATHPLGYNGLEFTYKRRWYLCRSHVYDDVNGYAKWEMNTMITMLNSDDPYDLSIITELEATSGWVDDLKTVTVKSVKGDEWVQQSTGYSFKCIDNNNTWFRIRSTYLNLITDTTLINQIKAVTKEQWGSGNVYNLPSGNQGDFFADDTDTYTYFCIDTASHTWKRIGQQPARFAAITDATLIAEIEAHDFAATPKLTPVATEQGVHLQEHCWENPAGTIHYARKVKIGTQFYWVKIK